VQMQRDESKGTVLGLRDSSNKATPLLRKFYKENAYSLFTYTDVVLMPITKKIAFQSISKDEKGNPLEVSLKVTVVTQEGDQQTSRAIRLKKPKIKARTWKDWIRVGTDGKAVWKDGKPDVLRLAEYYGSYKKLEVAPIGEKQMFGKDEWDFSTNWGLVDIRTGMVVRNRFKKETSDEGEKWVPVGNPLKSQEEYLVVRELNPPEGKEPLYRRIIREKKPSPSEEFRYDYEYIWEPEVADQIEQAIKQKTEGEAGAGEKKPEPAETDGKAAGETKGNVEKKVE